MNPYWISFASNNANLGCCIVDANSPEEAIKKTKKLKINPGGEALAFQLPSSALEDLRLGKNRLIPSEELQSNRYTKLGDLDNQTRTLIETHKDVSVICGDCNK